MCGGEIIRGKIRGKMVVADDTSYSPYDDSHPDSQQ